MIKIPMQGRLKSEQTLGGWGKVLYTDHLSVYCYFP